jgi:hypothetical protein
MAIRIDAHAAQRAEERGAGEGEIRAVLETGVSVPARQGRTAKARVFPFGKTRLGRRYDQKRVEVVYTTEEDDIIVVTVYVFYGRWE